jgi:chemotaxis protein methyltransferase CheR
MLNDREIAALLGEVYERSGYDFCSYSIASMKRRIQRLIDLDHLHTVRNLRERLANDDAYLKRFVEEVTVNVTEMFRDPVFYKVLRKEIIPQIGSKPFIRIWHAGCSTGEEVYSMAILLKEANLLHRSLMYATDINPDVLEKARMGMFPLSSMQTYSQNYLASGGAGDFSSYYTANYGQAKFSGELSAKIIFSTHNLVSDSSFNVFDLIMCRNVLIYFNRDLQEKVFTLFDESLEKLGFLALGTKETLKFSGIRAKYRQVGKERIWRKTV